ncbi:hypothetical protein ACP4OV_018483 [Aristida adscensionis]
MASAASSPAASWSDLLPDLLGRVIALLPFPDDRARFRAVCRAWHAAMRGHYKRQLPWIVYPDGSFGTVGDDATYFPHLPGLPENVTCLGATDDWLALDCTDDVFRRTFRYGTYCRRTFTYLEPRSDVFHKHTYLLYNPFSRKTVSLPELDSIFGRVPETFEIRKILMRSNSPDDIIAVTTSNWNYNIILFRPGKGMWVMHNLRIFDVVFHGDRLYGITPDEDLVAFDLALDDDGGPTVTKFWRVIRQPLADGEEDHWSWMYDDIDEEDIELPSNDEEDGEFGDGVAQNQEEEIFKGDGKVPYGEDIMSDEEVAYEPKDLITITRYLVKSCDNGELLMVRHYQQSPPYFDAYTRNIEVFKADISGGKWLPTNGPAKGEALFLSRPFCKSTSGFGNIKEGFIYFTSINDVFDTRSWSRQPFKLSGPWLLPARGLLTWLFLPELVV